MTPRRMLAEALACMPGFIDLGSDGWEIRPSRRERQSEQTTGQRRAALARAAAKRARKNARRLALRDAGQIGGVR